MCNCRIQIFYLFKHRGERAYLLHVNNGRYAQYAIPVREGTTIYTDTPEIKTPTNCIKINATECFPCNILPLAEHSKNTLRSRRGIPCDQSWAYITEYNFRMSVANNENVGDIIMNCQYIWTYIYAVYVRFSIFNPVFALNFVVSLTEHDGFTYSG